MRSQGYAVEDYLIRRNKELREHIAAYNQAIVQRNIDAVIVFHGLDIDAFLAKNSSPQTLKEALTKRDAYYEKIANNASELKKKNEKLRAGKQPVEERTGEGAARFSCKEKP